MTGGGGSKQGTSVGFTKARRDGFANQTFDAPGPGQYSPQRMTESGIRFPSAVRTKMSIDTGAPGPGTYRD